MRKLCEFFKSIGGNTAISFALVSIPVMAIAGGAVDMNRAHQKRSEVQAALDAAVLAGIRQVQANRVASATRYFNANISQLTGASVTSVQFTNVDAMTLKGVAMVSAPTSILGIVGQRTIAVTVSTTATLRHGSAPCIIVMDEHKRGAFRMTSPSTVDGDEPEHGCEVHSHSDSIDASVEIKSDSNVQFNKVCMRGGSLDTIKHKEEHCSVSPDPYVGKQPPVLMGACDYTDKTFTAEEMPLNPGVYCGKTVLPGTILQATFNPGLYIIKGGDFDIEAKNVTGNGVTFYFADELASISMKSIDSITLSAPTTGEYKDWLMFHDEAQLVNNIIRIDSVNNATLTGIIHTPKWDYYITSPSFWTTQFNLIANSVDINSVSSWRTKPDDMANANYIPVLVR